MLRASSGTSGYSKMLALHHVQIAKQYLGTLPRAQPKNIHPCWPKYCLAGCSWPTGKKNRPGLQAPKQKLLQKQAPKKGCQKWTLKRGPPYLPEPWGPQIGVPELFSKLGTKPTQPDQFHAFSCNTWIGKEAVTGKVPMRPFQAFRKRLKYVRWDGGPPWKGKYRRFSTASGRPSGTKSKACLTNCCLVGPLHTRHFETWPNHEAGIV